MYPLFAMCDVLSPGSLDENVANISRKTILANSTQNGAWRVRLLKAWYLAAVSDVLTAPLPWLFSKNNSFAHEDPDTTNALMSVSVKGKSLTHHHSTNRFHPSPSGSLTSVAAQLPTNSKEFFFYIIDATNGRR
jgi:hypothetical protein